MKRPDLSLLDDVLKDTKLSTDGIVAYMDQQNRDIKALEETIDQQRLVNEIARLRTGVRDVLDLFVKPKNARERKAAKYLRSLLEVTR